MSRLPLPPLDTHTTCAQMEAERRLVSAAALDARNARFVLLSETCGPLYPAPAVYTQLMAEAASRVNACSQAGDEERRMAYRREQWRRGGWLRCRVLFWRRAALGLIGVDASWAGRAPVRGLRCQGLLAGRGPP